jgi:hypothetical protein
MFPTPRGAGDKLKKVEAQRKIGSPLANLGEEGHTSAHLRSHWRANNCGALAGPAGLQKLSCQDA